MFDFLGIGHYIYVIFITLSSLVPLLFCRAPPRPRNTLDAALGVASTFK